MDTQINSEQINSEFISSLAAKLNETRNNKILCLLDSIAKCEFDTDNTPANDAIIQYCTNILLSNNEEEAISFIKDIDTKSTNLVNILSNNLENIHNKKTKLAARAKIDAHNIYKNIETNTLTNNITNLSSESIETQKEYAKMLYDNLKDNILKDMDKTSTFITNMDPNTTSLIVLNMIIENTNDDKAIEKYTLLTDNACNYFEFDFLTDGDNSLSNATNYLNMLYYDATEHNNMSNFNSAIDNLNQGLSPDLSATAIALINQISTSQNPQDLAIKDLLQNGNDGYLKALLNFKTKPDDINTLNTLLKYYMNDKKPNFFKFMNDMEISEIPQKTIIQQLLKKSNYYYLNFQGFYNNIKKIVTSNLTFMKKIDTNVNVKNCLNDIIDKLQSNNNNPSTLSKNQYEIVNNLLKKENRETLQNIGITYQKDLTLFMQDFLKLLNITRAIRIAENQV